MTLAAVKENQEQVAPGTTDSSEQAPKPVQKKPWQRMESESLLWFNRFSLYLELGYKRTLLAALHKEQEKAKVLNSTQIRQKTASKKVSPSAKATKKPGLAEVPQSKREQVPSSWKIAAQKWNWKERCRAYDESVIEQSVEKSLLRLSQGVATKINRVEYLKCMFKTLADSCKGSMPYDQLLAIYGRMQSILRDIANEMKDYDEAASRLFLKQETWIEYMHMTPEMVEERRKVQK